MKNNNRPFVFRGKKLFCGVLILYGLFFLLQSQSGLLALQKSSAILIKILPIIALVILLTTTLNLFIKPKQLARHLGRESGVKGWFWALTAGVISHGPMYVWYPLIDDLRNHGMKDEYVVVFFASRAIKVPLLPIMIDYFGLTFTIILSIYLLLGALLQGLCLQICYSRE